MFEAEEANAHASLRQATEDLAAIAQYDQSLSIGMLGSLFHDDGEAYRTAGRASRRAAFEAIPQSFVRLLSMQALQSRYETHEATGERWPGMTAVGALQRSIAEVYGVPWAWPSTNGTTPLNAMALATVAPAGSHVLIQRDCHVSVLAGVIQADLRTVYLCPEYDPALGLSLGPTPDQITALLDAHPGISAALLTYPNYFGIATDIERCARPFAERGIPLILDAAHGAHLRFHPALPLPAEQTSAALITHSTHKTLSALSQGSIALLTDLRYKDRWYDVVNQLGYVSTSFSFPILLSLGLALLQFTLQGRTLLEQAIVASQEARAAINAIAGLRCVDLELARPGFVAFDPLRLTVDVYQLDLTGYAVAEQLRKDYHLYPEMATLRHVLFLLHAGDDAAWCQRIVAALRHIADQAPRRRKRKGVFHEVLTLPAPALPRQLLTPRAAFFHQRRRRVSIAEAVGCPSAETIAAYPPGSAVIVAGEELTSEIAGYLARIQTAGGTLKGTSDPTFASMLILE